VYDPQLPRTWTFRHVDLRVDRVESGDPELLQVNGQFTGQEIVACISLIPVNMRQPAGQKPPAPLHPGTNDEVSRTPR